jgi:hypothetical protein
MRKENKQDKRDVQKKEKKKLKARIPITEWPELDRKMAIISRMTGA